MKKLYTVVAMILLVLFCIGCSDEDVTTNPPEQQPITADIKYEVFRYNSYGREDEYIFANPSAYSHIIPEASKEAVICGQKMMLTYVETEYRYENYFPEYKYENENGEVFYFDDRGYLTGADFDFKSEITEKISESECVETAKKIIPKEINLSDYRFYIEDRDKLYALTFVKETGDLQTKDYVVVRVYKDGTIDSYTSSMLGRIPTNIDLRNVDLDNAFSKIKGRLDIDYGESRPNRVYFESDPKITILKDGTVGLLYIIEVESGYIFDVHRILVK